MSSSLVSVIIPNFNHEKFLKRRIDSILNQSFQNFEVILLDDASTDNSLEVLNTYKNHPKVSHFIVNNKNTGSPFVQWKKGIELAKGAYVWIAETDDFAEPTFLEETVKVLQNKPEVSLAYTDSLIIDSENNPIDLWSTRKNTFFKTNRWSYNYENDGYDEILNFMLYKVTINNTSAVLFRKKYLLGLDLLVTYKNAGDLYTYCNMLSKGTLSYIALPLNNYRDHAANATKTNSNNGIFYIDALNCYSEILNMLLLNQPLSISKKEEIKKAFIFIIHRFGFKLVDYGYVNELKNFILNLTKRKVLKRMEAYSLVLGFKIYSIENTKLKYFTKNIIRDSKKV